jgi:hypothetical protein
MSHQIALTVVAEVRPEAADDLRALLATMGDGVANDKVLDFGSFAGLHFARLVLVEESTDLKGDRLPASLLYMSDLDLPKDRHLGELADVGGEAIDRLFGHCVGYPQTPTTPEQRLAYLRRHVAADPVENEVARVGPRQAEARTGVRRSALGHSEQLQVGGRRHTQPHEQRWASTEAREFRRMDDRGEGRPWFMKPSARRSSGAIPSPTG